MTDKVVAVEASNLFGLGANFKPQNSASPHSQDNNVVLDSDGDVACSNQNNSITNYDNSFGYCNDTPDIKLDLGAILTAYGTVVDSKMLDELTINFEKGLQATLDASGHQHDDNPHVGTDAGIADVSAAIAGSEGFGVPDYGITLGDNATPISATLGFSWGNHIDENDADGEHWSGTNTTVKAELSIELLGIPTSITVAALETDMTGWTVLTNGPADDNQALDRFMITAERYFDLT